MKWLWYENLSGLFSVNIIQNISSKDIAISRSYDARGKATNLWLVLFINEYWVAGSFPVGSAVKNPSSRDPGSVPGLGRFPWMMTRQPIPVFLPGESHGQRSLAGYSAQGCKASDTTEVTKDRHMLSGFGLSGCERIARDLKMISILRNYIA